MISQNEDGYVRGKTVLITGVAGFIASHLAEKLLTLGYRVIGIDNFDSFYSRSVKEQNLKSLFAFDLFKFFEFDITKTEDYNLLNEQVECVFHFAAKAGVLPSVKDPPSYMHVNISGTQQLLDWMVKKNVRKIIFASSSSVYGNNKKIPFSETDNVDKPISPYAFTKKACELMLHTYFHLYGINSVSLRFFTVYGERQRPDLAIHKFVKLISNQKEISLFGKGESSRDYTYINDIINGVMAAFSYIQKNNEVYEIINLGNNKPVTLNNLVQTISEVLNITPQIRFAPARPGDVEITYADISKAKKLLGYNPTKDFKSGIENFVRWYTGINSETFKN